MKTLSTFKRSLWRYILLALWLCGTFTAWGQTVLERGDVASSMNTLKKKVLYIFSLLFISTFLYAQIPNPIVLEWAFPDQPGVENPTSPAKDARWFAPSTNNYDVLFDAKPASYGLGVERDGISSCVSYFGIVSGVNGVSVDVIPFGESVQTTTISNINASGDVELEIYVPNDRIAMDNLTWTTNP